MNWMWIGDVIYCEICDVMICVYHVNVNVNVNVNVIWMVIYGDDCVSVYVIDHVSVCVNRRRFHLRVFLFVRLLLAMFALIYYDNVYSIVSQYLPILILTKMARVQNVQFLILAQFLEHLGYFGVLELPHYHYQLANML